MARRRTGWRRLSAVVIVTLIAAASCPAQPPPKAAPLKKVDKDNSIPMHKPQAPEIAVLDYLGRYAEAGDGIDPLGLADGEMAAEPDAEPKRPPGDRR